MLNQHFKTASTGSSITPIKYFAFPLYSGQRALGPILVLPDAIFQWNIATPLHAKPESFALVEILHPKPQCVIFGYGSATQVESRKVVMQKKKTIYQLVVVYQKFWFWVFRKKLILEKNSKKKETK